LEGKFLKKMKHIQPVPNKVSAIEKALQYARDNGEPVIVGDIPKQVRLICFDMDATLIRMETINEIAAAAAIGKQMEELTLRAMRGEDDFRTSFLKRVEMLLGVPVSTLNEIASNMPYAKGLPHLMEELQHRGIETAVITGNFSIFGEYLKKSFNFNHIYTTVAGVGNGALTGTICGSIIDAPAKSSILLKICSEKNIPLSCTIAVGDGANDIPMLSTAAAAIAYNAISAKVGLDEVILPLL
jgi:phosphoserine phosphatase